MTPLETKIRDLVSRGELQQAMTEVKTVIQKTDDADNLNALTELQSQLALLNQEKNTGLLSETNAGTQRAQIDMRFLETVTALKIPDWSNSGRDFNHKILFFASNPSNTAKTQLYKECAKIKEAIDGSEYDLVVQEEFTPDFMIDKITILRPGIVHFSGHGSDDQSDRGSSAPCSVTEGILVKTAQGELQSASDQILHDLFFSFNKLFQIEVVFLNACHSSGQAEAIKNVVPYVVCMNNSIPVETSIQFAAHFYKLLFAANNNVPVAFNLAFQAMKIDKMTGATVPALYENGKKAVILNSEQ